MPWWRRDPFLPEPGWFRARWRGLALVGALVAAGAAFDGWLFSCGFAGCPTAEEIRAYRPTEGGRILDRSGNEIGQLKPIQRVNVSLGQVPQHVREAFLATEDRRFYEHHGIDLRGVARAVVRNAGALGVREGFSTISMQVARNTFLAERFHYSDRSLRKKLLELRVSGLLERHLSKDEIFELYLNAVYLGNGTYGVEAASRDLFGRSVEHVTPDEGALLAALPKGPSSYTPRRSMERAKQRRDLVLALMAREGYLTEEEAKSFAERPLEVEKPSSASRRYGNSYPLDMARAFVDSLLGRDLAALPDLVVHTTIDATAQRAAERAVARQAAAIQRRVPNARGNDVQGAFVAISPEDGGILALVGGREHVRQGFNRAVAAHRQPGSAFKPFVYAAALERGYTTASMVEDEPVSIEQNGRIWQPANADGRYLGSMTFREALARSSNAAAVRITRAVGEQRVAETARRNGITSKLTPVPSIALGSLEVTPLELVSAYAPFANGGMRVEPHLVEKVETVDGRVLWQRSAEQVRVMDPRDAFLITSMLQSVVDEGTARSIRASGVRGPVAGKTGTTNDGTDVWFVGYTPSLVAGAWFGFDTPRSLGRGAAGGSLAAPAWSEFYREAWVRHDRGAEWSVPDGLVRRFVDSNSGLLADEWCSEGRYEWFREGTEPTRTSECWYWNTDCSSGDESGTSGWFREFRSRLRDVFRINRPRQPEAPEPPAPVEPPDGRLSAPRGARSGDLRPRDAAADERRMLEAAVREARSREAAARDARTQGARKVSRALRQAQRELSRQQRTVAAHDRDLQRVRRELERSGMSEDVLDVLENLIEESPPALQERLARVADALAGSVRQDGDPMREMQEMQRKLQEARALTLTERQARRQIATGNH